MTCWTREIARGNFPVAVAAPSTNRVTTLLGPIATVSDLRSIIDQAAPGKGTNLAAIATSLGVTRQYLARVSSGGTMPADLYIDLCTCLGIDPKAHATLTDSTLALTSESP